MTYYVLILFAVLQLADIATTYYALERQTGNREANPVMDRLFRRTGVLPGLLLAKAVLLMLVVSFLTEHAAILGMLCLLYVYIVARNLYVIFRRL